MTGQTVCDLLAQHGITILVKDLYQKMCDWGMMKRERGRGKYQSKNIPCTQDITLVYDEGIPYERPDFNDNALDIILRKFSVSAVAENDVIKLIDQTDPEAALPTSISKSLKYYRSQFRKMYGSSLHTYYLGSARWARKRERVFETYGKQCYRCTGDDNLQVHHLTYLNWVDELMIELVPLCESCHRWIHSEWDNDIKSPYREHMANALEDIRFAIKVSWEEEEMDKAVREIVRRDSL